MFSAEGARVLEALAQLLAESPLAEDLPARAVDRVVELLGLSGATLSLVRRRGETLNLETVASVGAHAAFARDMSARPLESLADAATAVTEGKPVYVVDEHGPASASASETGVARWRSSISAHATGVLPVRAWGETLGVLTIEWPGSRPLGPGERALLESAAGLLGTVLHAMRVAEEGVAGEAEVAAGPQPSVDTAVFGVTDVGVVVPLPEGVSSDLPVALTASFASRRSGGGEEPVRQIIRTAPGRTGLALGLAASPGDGAAEVARFARETIQTYASEGLDPAEALAYLEHGVRALAQHDARVSVVGCSVALDGPARSVTFSAAGAAMWAVLSSDGRVSLASSSRAALSATGAGRLTDHHRLLLPGDRMAFLCGQVGALDSARGRTSVREALEHTAGSGIEAALRLLDELGDDERAAAVVVIDIPGPPQT